MSSPKLRVIFRPKSEIQTFFSPKIRWSPKNKKKVFTKIESDFSAEIGNSNVFFARIQVVSKKKKKKVFTKIESDFSAGFVTFRLVGGDASRNGAELFEIEADFSAKIVTLRLVGGGCIPPSPPPKSATGHRPTFKLLPQTPLTFIVPSNFWLDIACLLFLQNIFSSEHVKRPKG